MRNTVLYTPWGTIQSIKSVPLTVPCKRICTWFLLKRIFTLNTHSTNAYWVQKKIPCGLSGKTLKEGFSSKDCATSCRQSRSSNLAEKLIHHIVVLQNGTKALYYDQQTMSCPCWPKAEGSVIADSSIVEAITLLSMLLVWHDIYMKIKRIILINIITILS